MGEERAYKATVRKFGLVNRWVALRQAKRPLATVHDYMGNNATPIYRTPMGCVLPP